jgi:hypothetical protein
MSNMELPNVNKFISNLCIITCANKRYVGYYHSNGFWYVYQMNKSHTECLQNKVISWEYLNPTDQ